MSKAGTIAIAWSTWAVLSMGVLAQERFFVELHRSHLLLPELLDETDDFARSA